MSFRIPDPTFYVIVGSRGSGLHCLRTLMLVPSCLYFSIMSERPGSNWRPKAWKAFALPTELLSLNEPLEGLEPTTCALQMRCSSQLSYKGGLLNGAVSSSTVPLYFLGFTKHHKFRNSTVETCSLIVYLSVSIV